MLGSYALPTHKQKIAQLDAKYQSDVKHGIFRPYVSPLCFLGVLVIFIYFLVPHRDRPLVRRLRFVVWATNLIFSLYIILNFRARRAPIDYGVGLATWWFVLWTAAVMVVHDGQLEFARIERAAGATQTLQVHLQRSDPSIAIPDGVPKQESSKSKDATTQPMWQTYPTESFTQRVDWVVDLLSTFRGMTWNWRIANLPQPPKEVQNFLKEGKTGYVKELSRSQPALPPISRRELVRNSARRFIIGYLCLDFLRTLTIHDPYFRGLGAQHIPAYLPPVIQKSPALLQAYRLIISLLAIYWALATIFQLAPLFFCGVLGVEVIGVRGETWVYPREWGTYKVVLEKGLAAWWSVFWHQTFRFAFEAPSKRLVEILKIDRRSITGKALQLFIAFALSGSIHAAGSYTSIGDTRPFGGPFMFFILQPFGIITQLVVANELQKAGITKRMPAVLRQATNLIFVHTWFFFTAPLLIEDLAKGGTFMYEPVPFSIFRLIGLGGKNESSICWASPLTWVRWHTADKWWETGLSA